MYLDYEEFQNYAKLVFGKIFVFQILEFLEILPNNADFFNTRN